MNGPDDWYIPLLDLRDDACRSKIMVHIIQVNDINLMFIQ